jgi:hypothetical protein
MATIHYKRLFEVRILHDYFLARPDLTSIYALNANDKLEFLNRRILNNQYMIWNYLDLIPSEETRNVMANYHIRLALLPAGFMVGIQVRPQLNGAGEEKYLPFIPIDDSIRLGFNLEVKSTDFKNITNLKINHSDPAHYYFSNSNEDNSKIFPSLSLPVKDFQTGNIYETGELAILGGILREAREETSSPAPAFWRPVEGSGLASEQDRIVLPKLFSYRFPVPVNAAEFSLKKSDGSLVKSSSVSGTGTFRSTSLNFRQTTPGSGESPENIPDDLYRLEVSTDMFNETRNIYMSDDLYRRTNIAAIVIESGIDDPEFKVLNNDGTLVTKKKADGSIDPHPVFEIRFKRRSTYWRYRSDSGESLKTTVKTALFLDEDNGHLVTKELRPLSFYATRFEDPAAPADPGFHLPVPGATSITREMKRLFSDVYVSPVKGLINVE